MLSSLNLEVKAKKYFVSSSNLFLDKKTLLKIWLNPGLNLTTFRGTGPWRLSAWFRRKDFYPLGYGLDNFQSI